MHTQAPQFSSLREGAGRGLRQRGAGWELEPACCAPSKDLRRSPAGKGGRDSHEHCVHLSLFSRRFHRAGSTVCAAAEEPGLRQRQGLPPEPAAGRGRPGLQMSVSNSKASPAPPPTFGDSRAPTFTLSTSGNAPYLRSPAWRCGVHGHVMQRVGKPVGTTLPGRLQVSTQLGSGLFSRPESKSPPPRRPRSQPPSPPLCLGAHQAVSAKGP